MNFTLWEFIIVFVILLLPIVALVDILKSSFRNPVNKIVWTLLVLFLPALGTILYFLIGAGQKVRSKTA
jgi:hypothetical protein